MGVIMAGKRRKILSWGLSNTMDSNWCCEVLEDCIEKYGRPEIINMEQGSQFTSDDSIYRVINNGIKLKMDGQGRAKDNIYKERFWRTIKYEHIYLKPSRTGGELYESIRDFIKWYYTERRHTEIGNNKPDELYNQLIMYHHKAA